MMRRSSVAIVFSFVSMALVGCGPKQTLSEARRGFHTQLVRQEEDREAVEVPPKGVFTLVKYTSPVESLPAYLSTPTDNKKHPAIVWITGGDCNSIGKVWGPVDPENDQSARAFRQAGIVMLFPSLRGGNQSRSQKESFLGEVDDIVAAADFLAKQPSVDPQRIYLGGHSTGGTLALLVSESTDRFRAIFAFGPVDDVAGYQGNYLTCALTNDELRLRSPIHWLDGIKSPTYVFEGDQQGNADSLRELQGRNRNPKAHFRLLPGYSHFSILTPTNAKLAHAILQDSGAGEFQLTQL